MIEWTRILGQVVHFTVVELSGSCMRCADTSDFRNPRYMPAYILYGEFALWATGDPIDSKTVSTGYCDSCGLANAEMELICEIECAIRNRWRDRAEHMAHRAWRLQREQASRYEYVDDL